MFHIVTIQSTGESLKYVSFLDCSVIVSISQSIEAPGYSGWDLPAGIYFSCILMDNACYANCSYFMIRFWIASAPFADRQYRKW